MENKAGWRNRRRVIRALRILMQVCFWGCVVAGSMVVLGCIFLFIWPEAVAKAPGILGLFGAVELGINDATIFSIGKINPIFDQYLQRQEMLQGILAMGPWEKLIFLYRALPDFAMALFFYQFYQLMGSVEKGRPFTPENAKRLVIMGLVPIGISVVMQGVRIGALMGNSIGLFSIPQSYNLGGLFLGLILLVLSRVFKHGQYLQDEYDATL